MGQKIHPYGFRLGVTKDWKAKWYAEKDFGKLFVEDRKIRDFITKNLSHAGISNIIIERAANKVKLVIFTGRPGLVIGRKGQGAEQLKKDLSKFVDKEVMLEIKEVRRPETDAQIIADGIASQLERRVAYRRAMKRAVTQALRMGAQGIKVACSGRLAGAEIARQEWYREGRVPLHTLRSDVDYGFSQAYTIYGVIGVKVWVFHGEIVARKQEEASA
ncbi:MAG: 30S ribosomal protein S3 [Desulfomonilia bacterium]|uniref:30S ribosomal subunit protein S3 n=1 Tax=anaerobic digester metagenome TaxID=1263854 RepID=A0A485LYZ2_9ZZZZ|nr:30S ribosomal protein S3 [Pseudomonadota bacterium]HON39753.1 30S ribosomal protein S3 [Deltaproteobacteria bacterium]HRS57245.1 30S ribosomal protein S3 [Desulfomonilia bacterium]HPD22314.1 30S ribosomal protein S3 [Deltaproteobacteria bacterium]HPX19325.1 30S ribosomal protein S3 [Deltaproteobacteria bacterium]